MTIFREPPRPDIQAMRDDPAQFCAGLTGTQLLPYQEEFLRWLEKREAVSIGEKPCL